ncbi:putative ribosomal protein L24e/L24 superfamily [Helianthus anomalus]
MLFGYNVNFTFTLVIVIGLSNADSVAIRFTLVRVVDSSDLIHRYIMVFLFANSKCKMYFHNKLKSSKLTWTACTESSTRRRQAPKKSYSRLFGVNVEVYEL